MYLYQKNLLLDKNIFTEARKNSHFHKFVANYLYTNRIFNSSDLSFLYRLLPTLKPFQLNSITSRSPSPIFRCGSCVECGIAFLHYGADLKVKWNGYHAFDEENLQNFIVVKSMLKESIRRDKLISMIGSTCKSKYSEGD